MKRVYCLYRVSTKAQVEKDDIPMQRQACHEFTEFHGWKIEKELVEKGVSGYKVSANNRDAIQVIKTAAVEKKFDILLVFMFDRLGRRDDETPFIVEWFAKNGIEVWSVMEGQQKFDCHVDKLMNYIRFWQASGESEKTSIRTKTRLGQIVQQGFFKGGTAAYGYQLVKLGRIGKKNKELNDIVVNAGEAEIVKMIYDLADNYGYGGRRISSELDSRGVLNTRTGEPFHYSTLQRILGNVMYIGILRSGEIRSDIFPELQIIEPEQFYRVSSIRDSRSTEYKNRCKSAYAMGALDDSPLQFPRRVAGKALLSGNIYCAACGGRMFATTARKSHHPTAEGTYERVPIYKCYNRTQHKHLCDGPTSFRADRIDKVINNILNDIFLKLRDIEAKDLIDQQTEEVLFKKQAQLKKTLFELSQSKKELAKWEALMLESLEGACVFTPVQIKKRMESVQEAIENNEIKVAELKNCVSSTQVIHEEIKKQYSQLVSWSSIFAEAEIDQKKIIAGYLIKKVTVERNYVINVDLSITQEQFLSGLEMV